MGVISADSWPKSSFGQERNPGEYWVDEGDGNQRLHCMFNDEEADELVSNWTIVSKEKYVRYLRDAAKETTLDEWMALHAESPVGHNRRRNGVGNTRNE